MATTLAETTYVVHAMYKGGERGLPLLGLFSGTEKEVLDEAWQYWELKAPNVKRSSMVGDSIILTRFTTGETMFWRIDPSGFHPYRWLLRQQ